MRKLNLYVITGFENFAEQLYWLKENRKYLDKDSQWHFILEHPNVLLLRTGKKLPIDEMLRYGLQVDKKLMDEGWGTEAPIVEKYIDYLYPIFHLASVMALNVEKDEEKPQLLERIFHVSFMELNPMNDPVWYKAEPELYSSLAVARALYNGVYHWGMSK